MGFFNVLAGLLASGGAAAALPQAANIAFRMNADSITPQTDNTALSSWTDSISGLSATQATGANQPVYRVARLGGKPSVQFTGTRWLAGSFPALKTLIDAKTYTVMIAFNNTAAVGNGSLFGNCAGGNSFMFQSTGSTIGRFDLTNVAMSVPYTSTNFATLGYTSSATKLYPSQSGAGLERLFVNGCCVTSNTSAGPATTAASGQFGIGAISDLGTFACKADIYEIIVWNRVLTPLEFLQAETFLCTKYSQTLPWAGLSSFDVYTGDSITVGVGVTLDVKSSYPYLSAAARSRSFGQWMMWGVGGCQWTDINSMVAEWGPCSAYMGVPFNVAAFEWYNEKNTGNNGTQAYNHAVTFCTTARAVSGVKLCLLSSTGYTGDAADPYAAVRGVYNALLDTNYASMCDQYAPIHTDATAGPLIGDALAYGLHSATYWAGDGIHLITAGKAVLAPVATAGMNAMRP